MPMDYCYTTESERPSVYHVIFMCSEAAKIKSEHRKYGKPPASENRQPCQVCLDTIGAWLKSLS